MLKWLEMVSSEYLTNRVVIYCTMYCSDCTTPTCHDWPAFQAVECSSMQSWSPLDVSRPAPGLGEGEGSGGRSMRAEEGGRGEEKKGRGIEMGWESKWGRKEDKKQSLQYFYMLQTRVIIQNKHLTFSCTHTVLH